MKNFSYTVLPVFMPIPTKFRLSQGLFLKARNVPLRGIYFILLQHVALFYITGFSVRFPNFVSLKIEPYGKKKIQRVVLHQA